MKMNPKSLLGLLLALAVVLGGAQMAQAKDTRNSKVQEQTVKLDKKALKKIEKEAKNKAKEFKKNKWELVASSSTMETELAKYFTYLEEDPENREEIVGIAEGQSPNIARDKARMNALTSYASRAAADVVGKMKSMGSIDGLSGESEEVDRFGQAYEIAVNRHMPEAIREWFMIRQPLANGKGYTYNLFITMDEKAARKARKEAADEARRKANFQDLSTQVDEFIGQPVQKADAPQQ